jgi:hypothetical protein
MPNAPRIDPERLRRAIWLDVERVRHGEYLVNGHTVTGTDALTCDCADSGMRPDVLCKHRLAVLLHRGAPEVLALLRELVPMQPIRAPRKPRNGSRKPLSSRGRHRRYAVSTVGVGSLAGLVG